MVRTTATLAINADIVLAGVDHGALRLLSSDYTLYSYSSALKLLSTKKLIANLDPLHSFTNAPSFSSKQKNLMVPYGKKPLAILINILNKPRLQAKIDTPCKTIESSAFSPNSLYFALGDEDGRVNVFDTKSANYITSLTPKPDYINSLCFSPNERLLVSSSYDKTTTIFDITLNIEITTFTTSDVVVQALFFNRGQSIVLLQRNGAITVYHIEDMELLPEKNLLVSWPTCGVMYNDFLIVGMKNSSFCVINMHTFEVVFSEKVSSKGVRQLLVEEDNLYVFAQGMQPFIVDMHYLLSEFRDALALRDYEKVSKLLSKNSFLMLEGDYNQEMLEFYKPLFQELYTLLEAGKTKEAEQILAAHDDPKVHDFFTLISNGKEYIKQLAQAVKNKNYPVAFSLIEKYSYLSSSPIALKLENFWQKSFAKAKQLYIKKEVTSYKEAQRLLEPFSHVVSKKQLIHSIQKDTDTFIKADRLIQKKDFNTYFTLVKQHPFLEDNAIYKNILAMGQSYLVQLKDATIKNDFSNAKKLLKFLHPFIPLATEINTLKKQLIARITFFDAIQKKEINTVFSLAKESPFLRTFKEYEVIEMDFKKLLKESLGFAFLGDAVKIKAIFEPYENIELFNDKIASLYKIAYLNQIKKAVNLSDDQYKTTFATFMQLFGKSDDIEHTAKIVGKSELLAKLETPRDPLGFKKQPLPLNILDS